MATRHIRSKLVILLILACTYLAAGSPAEPAIAPEVVPEVAPATEAAIAPEGEPAIDAAANPDFWFEEVEGAAVFTQMLRWDPVPYSTGYDVLVQRQAGAGWETVSETRVDQSELEVRLAAGEYRYRLIVYNLLDKPAATTEWYPFTVVRARQPRVTDVSPDTIYFEEDNSDLFSVDGKNLLADSVYRFRSTVPPGRVYTGSVAGIDEDERNAEVLFSITDIEVGLYDLYVENPGGLSDALGPVKFAFIKPMDFDVSAGYMPLFVLWDDTIEQYFESVVFPLGTVVKATFIPLKRKFGYFGLRA